MCGTPEIWRNTWCKTSSSDHIPWLIQLHSIYVIAKTAEKKVLFMNVSIWIDCVVNATYFVGNICCPACWGHCRHVGWRRRCMKNSRSCATRRYLHSSNRYSSRWMNLTSCWRIHSRRAYRSLIHSFVSLFYGLNARRFGYNKIRKWRFARYAGVTVLNIQ